MNGSALFWDEPETNLNPSLLGSVVGILMELQRVIGVQIFISTHNYVLLKEFDLAVKKEDKILYHSLYRDKEDKIVHSASETFQDLSPNAIDDTFGTLIDHQVTNDMGRLGK